MRRIGFLYEKVMTLENVQEAYDLYNLNRPLHERRLFTLEEGARILAAMKADYAAVIGRGIPRDYNDRGKMRKLEIPATFEAAIAMLALWNVCGQFVESHIHDNSFSSRIGKGGHAAARKMSRFVRTKRHAARYCLYFDVKKFYAHIDKRIVMHRLEGIFKDARILELFRIVVYSTPSGLPIGYPFSHALANLYLAPLYWIARSTRGITQMYVYMDNHNVFAAHIAPLRRFLRDAKRWLAGVGCEVKDDWQIFPTDARPVKMCGLCVRSTGRRRLYRTLWRRTMRNFDRLTTDFKLSDYLGMQSRLGWLDLCGQRYCEAFKHEGGYLWR